MTIELLLCLATLMVMLLVIVAVEIPSLFWLFSILEGNHFLSFWHYLKRTDSTAQAAGGSSGDEWRSAFDSAAGGSSSRYYGANGHNRRYSDPPQNGDVSSGSGSRRTPNRLPPTPPQSGSSYRYWIHMVKQVCAILWLLRKLQSRFRCVDIFMIVCRVWFRSWFGVIHQRWEMISFSHQT